MKNFFEPESVAIIGASNHKEKVGYALVHNLKKFKGKVYPINLKEKSILGKKAYKSVLDVKGKIDLAVIAIPAKFVCGVVEECGKKNIKNIIIISSGFSEEGNNKEEEKLKKIIKKHGIKVMGPNNFGTVNTNNNLDTSFNKLFPKKGDIGFISQSGALWVYISQIGLDIGFSIFASLGNMMDINFSDVISYLNKDKKTKVIVCYIETLKNGKRFMEVCKKSKKPIIVIKAGRTKAGSKAALSHTASLAGEFEIYEGAFKQCGVFVADTIKEAFDKASFLSKQKLRGKKTIIITNGGGLGVLAADYCEKNGLNVISLPDKFVKSIKWERAWSRSNPIDLVGDADYEEYREIFQKLSKEKVYDNIIVIATQQEMIDIEKVAKEIADFKRKSGKTIVCCLVGVGEKIKKAKNLLDKADIINLPDINRVVKILK